MKEGDNQQYGKRREPGSARFFVERIDGPLGLSGAIPKGGPSGGRFERTRFLSVRMARISDFRAVQSRFGAGVGSRRGKPIKRLQGQKIGLGVEAVDINRFWLAPQA